jgi:hypothetical protein
MYNISREKIMRLTTLVLCLIVVGCGSSETIPVRQGTPGIPGEAGRDGSNGRDGANGVDGIAGKDGKDGTAGATGADGKDGVDGRDGIDGEDGKDGIDGKDGTDGTDGKDGKDGKDAEIQIVDPCGDAPGIIDEVLLILPDGSVLASFSETVEGRNTRFAVIPPGTYMTTDGSKCVFTLPLKKEDKE